MKIRSYSIWIQRWVVLFLVFLVRSVHSNVDPYKVLQIPRNASHEDIRKSYRSLCLRYHPDKNVGRSPKERIKCEETFKEIQKAYSLIGNAESRRNYDLLSRYATPYGSRSGGHRGFGHYPTRSSSFYNYNNQQHFRHMEEMFQDFFRQSEGFNFGAPSFRANSPPDFFNLDRFKSIYVQKVPVSMEDLFTGKSGYEMSFKGSLWQRLTGAFRGGLGLVLLYQSLLFTLPMLRFSKLASLALGLYLFQSHIPKPTKSSFYVDLKPGYKEGTKFTFTEQGFDVVFVLKEKQHPKFVRNGNDLYTTVYVTPRQARRGAKVRTSHLDGSCLIVEIPSGCKAGTLIRFDQEGWPDRRRNSRGDLFVQIRVKARKNR